MTEEHDARREAPTPPLCEVCRRNTFLRWHSVSVDILDETACSDTVTGQGFWLCADMCHPTAHELMKELAPAGAAYEAVLVMMSRLESAIFGSPRKYLRRESGS